MRSIQPTKPLLLLFFTMGLFSFTSISHGSSILNPVLQLNPDTPLTTNDYITAVLEGDFNTTGYQIDGMPVVNINDSNIQIDFNAISPDGIVLFVLTPFAVNADIGLLNAGIYDVTARFHVDNQLEHVLIDTIVVEQVPVPASAFLFGSGLLSLVSLAKRRKV